MFVKKVFDEIDRLEADFIRFWQDVCNLESPTNDKERVDRVGNYFVEWAQSNDFVVEKGKQDKAGDVVFISVNPKAEKPAITLSGHIDTVHPVGLFGTPAVRVDSERIYGPGVCDCKGGTVVAALTLQALKNCGFVDRPLRFILQTDEEGGSAQSGMATIKYMMDKAKGSIAFFNLEGHNEMDHATVQRKGIIRYLFKVYGVEVHASLNAKQGASAILEACHKIIELEKFKDYEGITCNCGKIVGGSVENTVSGYCEFTVEMRFSNSVQLAEIKSKVQELAESVVVDGCKCVAELAGYRPAMELVDRNVKFLETLNGIFERYGLSKMKPERRNGGSDVAYATEAKIPCLDAVGGVTGGRIHSKDEFALIASLKDAAKRLASAICCL